MICLCCAAVLTTSAGQGCNSNSKLIPFEHYSIYQATAVDDGLIEFPSITVCKKRTYDDYADKLIEYITEDNTTTKDIKAWVTKHTWNRTKVFKLVSHGNDGRPCLTNSGSVPGKPCIFPFVYPDCSLDRPSMICNTEGDKIPQIYTKCISEKNYGWCSTRTHWNNSHIVGEYGTCSTRCADQPYSAESLANMDFQYLWEEGFYGLLVSNLGHCHTYNPRHRSSSDHEEKFIAFLGKLRFYSNFHPVLVVSA